MTPGGNSLGGVFDWPALLVVLGVACVVVGVPAAVDSSWSWP